MKIRGVILWLDDLRNPYLNIEGKVPTHNKENSEVIWVCNYEDFLGWIELNGLPEVISFDHDLGEGQGYDVPTYLVASGESNYKIEKMAHDSEKTGMDCAKWLVEYCMDRNNLPLPKWHIHSANPVGAANIKGLLGNYEKHVVSQNNNQSDYNIWRKEVETLRRWNV